MSAATENAARLLKEAEAAHRATYGSISVERWNSFANSWIELARVEAMPKPEGSE